MASVAKREWSHKGVKKTAWVVRYVDRQDKHRSRQFEKKKDADEHKRQVENELEAGTHIAKRESRTVRDLITEFRKDVDRRCHDGVCGPGYVTICGHQLEWVMASDIGGILVRDLTWQAVEKFALSLRNTPSRYKRPLSKRTQRNIMTLFGTVLSYAVRRGYAARNVAPDAMREMGKVTPEKIETFNRGEVKQLLEAAELRDFRRGHRSVAQMRAMIYLAALCGMRKGEIVALRWADLDLDRRMIMIRHNLTNQDVLKAPKTPSGVRNVPMPAAVVEALEMYRPFVVDDYQDRGLIFRTSTGRKVGDVGFYKLWHPILLRAGFAPDDLGRWRHFHALRHFAGSAWLEAGIPLPAVSMLLGHANTQVTAEIYAHSIMESHHRSAEIDYAATFVLPSIAQIASPDCATIAHDPLSH